MKVIVDKPLTGWKELDENQLHERYDKIMKVGKHPELREDISDEKIGIYCKNHNCDFITTDRTAYTKFFEEGTEIILIKRYGLNTKSKQKVYLVKILDGL